MTTLELIVSILVGLWWIVWPGSAVRIYLWLRQRYSIRTDDYVPDPAVIRGVGIAWLLLVAIVTWVLEGLP